MDLEQKITVETSGAEKLNSAAKLVTPGGAAKLGGGGPAAPRLVTAAGGALRGVGSVVHNQMAAVVRVAATSMAPTLSTFVLALRLTYVTIKTGVRLIFGALEMMGYVVRFAGPIGVAVAAIGTFALAKYILIPLAKFMFGMKLIQHSLVWAQEQSEVTLRVAALARYKFAGATGSELEKGERKITAEMNALQIVAGDEAEEITSSTFQRFSRQQMQRGSPDAGIYKRWGITPEKVEALNAVGQDKPLDFLDRFISWREVLEGNERKFAEGTIENEIAKRWFVILREDVAKMFGQTFAELVMSLTHDDVVKIRAAGKDAEALGFVEGADQKAIDFNISLRSLQETFSAITTGIGGDIQPVMTRVLDDFRHRLVEPDEHGRVLGTSIRELGVKLAGKTWDLTIELIGRIDPEAVTKFLKSFSNSFDEDTSSAIATIDRLTGGLAKLFGIDLTEMQRELAAIPAKASASGGRGGGGGGAGEQPGVGTGPVQLSGNVGAESAVDEMMTMVGLHERDPRGRQLLMQYMRSGGHGMDPAQVAWCAAFVNAALQRAGIRGTRSNMAWSFSSFGTPVRPQDVAKGDVLVTSHHVGLATGRRTSDGRIEMVSGNTSDRVGITYVRPGQYLIRRPPKGEKRSAADNAYKVAMLNSFEAEIARAKLLSKEDQRKIQQAAEQSMAA